MSMTQTRVAQLNPEKTLPSETAKIKNLYLKGLRSKHNYNDMLSTLDEKCSGWNSNSQLIAG